MGLRKYAAPASTQIPRIAITFDDGFESVFTIAYPYLAAAGIKATVYATKDYIGTAGYMTEANLTTLYNAGWDIGNHSETHTNFTTLTQAQIETELDNCRDWLDGLGLTRASKHVAYPNGGYDADVEAAMLAQGMLSGRLSDSNAGFNYAAGITSVRQIHCNDTGQTFSTANCGAMSMTFLKNWVSVQLWHKLLVEGPPTFGYEMTQADFELMIDFIVSRRVATVTISELYALIS